MPQPIPIKQYHHAQVLSRASRDATGKQTHGHAGGETDDIVYERYKIVVLTQSDNPNPTFAAWARVRNLNSGLGGQVSFDPIIAANSFVLVEEDDNGDWVIVEVLSNVPDNLPQIAQQLGLPASGFEPDTKVPTTYINPAGNGVVPEQPQTASSSKEDGKQDKANRDEDILTACKQVNVEGINSEITNLIKDVEGLRTQLTGSDSFLVTSQKFINEEILGRVSTASTKIAEYVATLIQQVRRWVLRKINAGIGNLTGLAPLSTRYFVNQATDETLSIVSCLFIRLLANLENLIYQALSKLIDKVINTATCLVENFIGNFIGQIISQLTGLINAALRPISNLIGSVLSFANEILDFVISILDFLTCKPKNICPQVEKWNPLNGPSPPTISLDFKSIFESAKGTADAFTALGDIPEDISQYNFNFNPSSAIKDALTDCNLGPKGCGVPNVVFWGGIGSGASGNAVVNAVGDIIGVDIITPGVYSRAPVINFEDDCGNGRGATGIPVIDSPLPFDAAGNPIDGNSGTDGDGTGGDGTDGDGTDGDVSSGGISGVVITNPGYNYLPSPNGSRGGMGRVWADRCQSIVRRANGDWDTPYSEGKVIRLFYGDTIELPAKPSVLIDCDFTIAELPGAIEFGEKYCYKDMTGFDDGSGFYVTPPNIRSMVGFDDIRGSSLAVTPPISQDHIELVRQLSQTERALELKEEERKLSEAGGIPDFGRPDQFGYINDYPFAKELGFSDTDIRFYIEGFYSKLLGKRVGPLMRAKLEDPTFGPIPSWITGRAGAGLFDCENDYPYALSLGFNDKDIRYYLENVYLGEIDECMQKKLNDSNFGRVDYYVQITAPGCPPESNNPGYDVISEVGDVYVEDPGFGYLPGDTATVLDCSGNPDASAEIELNISQSGEILGVRVIKPGANFTCIPKIILNTDTGYNANLIAVMRFRKVDELPEGAQVLQVIDCVGKV